MRLIEGKGQLEGKVRQMHGRRLVDKYMERGAELVDKCREGWRKMNGLTDRSLSAANKDRWEGRWRVKRSAAADSPTHHRAVPQSG